MRAGQPWKRVVQVPVGLSVISNHEECRFGTYVFTDAPRAFLPGGLRHQKRKEMRDKMREQGGDSVVEPDLPRGSTLVPLPSLDIGSLSRAATANNMPESFPSKTALSPSFLMNSPGNPHHIMTPPGRKSTATGFEYSPPDLTRRSKSSLMMNTSSSRVSHQGGESELDSGMMNAPPPRTMSLLKVAIASQSNVGTVSSASNVQPYVTSPSNMQMAEGSSEGNPHSRKSRVGNEARPASVPAENKEDEELLDFLMDKSVPVVKRSSSDLAEGAPSHRRNDTTFAAIDEDAELLWEEEGDVKKDKVDAPVADRMESQKSVEGAACCFHEITASTFIDPVTNEPAILMVQTDITPKVVMEDLIMGMSEGQLKMLGGIFPRHVIEYMSFNNEQKRLETIGDLARHHRKATILFMDIVGKIPSSYIG